MTSDSYCLESTCLRWLKGDITEEHVDAIVNAANTSLLSGGGVDGAIHRKGGTEILEACRHLRNTDYPGGLPTGQAVITTAGRLPARRVIHTVGPIWKGGANQEAILLENSYRNVLELAGRYGLRIVAFPSISTGAYGYPIREASHIALETVAREVRQRPGIFEEIRFILFSTNDLEEYRQVAKVLFNL